MERHAWMARFNVVKVAILSKLVYRFNTIPTKIPVDFFFSEIDKQMLKFVQRCMVPK